MINEGTELNRIRAAYQKRKKNIPTNFYSFLTPANLYIFQRREFEVIRILNSFGINNLGEKKILDVGCGNGYELRNFIKYGAKPQNCYGIDLLDDRIKEANEISPNINFICGNAEKMTYSDEFFDIVLCFTVFTSIFDEKMKKNISNEMLRVLKKDGIIIWYDYFQNNPWNPDVRGVNKKEIYRLFQNCEIYLKRITLAPPITRTIASYFWILCFFLERLKILNTHYIGAIRKKY